MQIRELRFHRLGGRVTQRDLDAVTSVMRAAMAPGGDFFPQPHEREFQTKLAAREGAAHAVAMTSCGTALDACMQLLQVGPGDEVVTTPFTFVCTASTAALRGARVVFADIERDTLNLDPRDVRRRLTPRTKAVIAVHFAGLPCDIDAFDRITRDFGVPVVYDAAHALGAKYNGRPVGGRGFATCYSFQFHKVMTCLGEGGAVTTDDPARAEQLRQLRTFGYVYPRLDTYEGGAVDSLGTNYQMNKVQYAMGIAQLDQLDEVLAVRRAHMKQLHELLRDIPEIALPLGLGASHGSLLFVIQVRPETASFAAQQLAAVLRDSFRVDTARHYPPIWTWKAYAERGYGDAGCPVTSSVWDSVLTLPVSCSMTDEDCEYLAWAVRRSVEMLRRGTCSRARTATMPETRDGAPL